MGRSLLAGITVLCIVIVAHGQATKNRALPQVLNLTIPVSEKDLDRAIEDYNITIVFNPKSSEAYFNRGCLKQSKGDLHGALSDYNRTIEVHEPQLFLHRMRELWRVPSYLQFLRCPIYYMDAYYLRAGYDHVRHPGGGSHSRFVEHRVSGSGGER